MEHQNGIIMISQRTLCFCRCATVSGWSALKFTLLYFFRNVLGELRFMYLARLK